MSSQGGRLRSKVTLAKALVMFTKCVAPIASNITHDMHSMLAVASHGTFTPSLLLSVHQAATGQLPEHSMRARTMI